MTNQSEAIDRAEIVTGLPSRMHRVADGHVAESPGRVALIEDGTSWTYRELDRSVKEIAAILASLGRDHSGARRMFFTPAVAAVVQSVVVGRAVEGNEEVVAFVQLMQGSPVKSAELMAFINPQLTSYKRPSEIIVLDALPATSTGKILKHKLTECLRGA